MRGLVVEVEGLWKRFGEVRAVEDPTFVVERGQVYGLLGPNSAGKTTALRVLMGLERPTLSITRLFGTTVSAGRPEPLRVGAIIEQACFVPHLSGLRNLRLFWEAGGGHIRATRLLAGVRYFRGGLFPPKGHPILSHRWRR